MKQHSYLEQPAPLGLRFLRGCLQLTLLLSITVMGYVVLLGYLAYRSVF